MGLAEEIFEDKDGFIWIGTVNGLVLFDGYSTRSFRHNPNDSSSLAANNINAISQDPSDRIWVGLSRFGFSILDQNQRSFIHPCITDEKGNCMQGVSVNAITQASDSSMWVGSTLGLFLYSSSDHPQQLSAFQYDSVLDNSLSSNYILDVLVDSKTRLWVGTTKGINLFDPATGTFINYRTNTSFPSRQTLDIAEDANGKIWLTTRFIKESFLIYDEVTQNFIPVLQDREPYSGEYKFTFDQNNDIWIAARGVGAYHYDLNTGKQLFFDPASFKDHGYRNINGLNTITDRYGNVWITGNNVLKYPASGKTFSSISSDENIVISLYANSQFIWYSDQELKRFDKSTRQTTNQFASSRPINIRASSPEKSKLNMAYCIRDYDEEHIIVSTTRNIYKWNTKTNEYHEYPTNIGGPIREFVVTPDKQHLWLCGNQGSPILFDFADGSYIRPEYASSIDNVRCVAQEMNGDLWFGSGTSGLFYMSATTHEIQNFAPDHSDQARRLIDYAINDIAITEDYVWVATNLGLQKINKSTFEIIPIGTHNEFIENSFMSVLEDNHGVLWFGTQQGLFSFNPIDQVLRSFNPEDGLINTVYSAGSCYKDSTGNLYFGGGNGVDYFNPEEIGINPTAPDIYISKILVNNDALELSSISSTSLDLKHHENFLEIELLALHYTSPKSNTYAYRIMELDTTWRYLGKQRTITLANMRPGNYTLQARAANGDNVWCEGKTLLHIHIAPPFWATWWFVVLVIIFISAILFTAFKYHIHQIKTRERIKSEFNKRLTELESKALRSQMNPHFLFNSLNSMKSLISQGNTEKATQYITRFAQLIRQILANSEKPFVRLQEELEALRLYLEIEKLRFQNFTFEILVNDDVNADFIEVPPLILQPYVENAIWHGLMHLSSSDRKLTVIVAQEKQFLHLTIEDNGIGREQAQQIKSLGNARKGGMGMRLTEDRLNLLKSIYGQDVKITITDLMENGKSSGTRVEVQIPCVD